MTGTCYSWSPALPSVWQQEPSLQTKRAFGLLTEVEEEVYMVGGLDGTLSPLTFRQVKDISMPGIYCQAVEEEVLGEGGWTRTRCYHE